jgi:hypothetical protein
MKLDLIPSLQGTYEELRRATWNEVVYLTGPPSSGKTTLVKKLFEEKHKEYLHAYIDCFSIRNQAHLLSRICQSFHSAMNVRRSRAGKNVKSLPEPDAPVPVNDFYDAIIEYQNIAHDKGYRHLFVVLDQIEAFERTNMMDTFITLCRYNLLDIRLIIISCEHPVDMIHYVAHKHPSIAMSVQDRCQVVFCKEWSNEDIVKWILNTPPKKYQELYEKFVKNVVTLVTKTETKDPTIIRMYCQEHFEDFIIYYNKRRKEQVLKQLGLDSNSSEITEQELDNYELQRGFSGNLLVSNFLHTFKVLIQKNKDNSKWTSSDKETHLPKNTAILIIAAYIAAYSKISDDKDNFIRYQRKKSSSRRRELDKKDLQNKLFSLERLVQIYLELMKISSGTKTLNIINNNDGVLADIERLKNLGILHHKSGFQFCSDARYKLSDDIKNEYIGRIADNWELQLQHFQGLPETFSANK